MIMTIEEYVRRKIRPKEGDVLIILDELYQVVESIHYPSATGCNGCHLDGKKNKQ